MTEVVRLQTTITFRNSNKVFHIPEALEITPDEILDERHNVYRVSIGRSDILENDTEYKALYKMLDSKLPFVDGIKFQVNGAELLFDLAYVMRTENDIGIFYDIEAVLKDYKYKEKEIEECSICA
jgi:hypothetical protein